ncbi:MAG: alcohol dehydrogenase catalytic domain-containing protein [Candidatus Micrarchaeales archaeon]|jgi:Zn-dependent alcohol dehydrogenases|uniref:Alcohol dehydrogenase GroES domain protein n=1 Tax=Candidatus Micrarchaeum acidiphilum ARMAN-2 TaxID=425595 RepID=C7DGS8_MICA2|nr:MAG: Alcohol dehydrogenase GroES domain protein [Candidatus Micrarchaeum acidiphilum ARMAN-2]MCW6161523.1 alcohol dehydrogenase catalytic domain-containing protein [Candidatus Micrarchaeales archaeon]
MKAAVFDKNGIENLKVLDIEKPVPASGEALVKVASAAINPIDDRVINKVDFGGKPHIPGAEVAGVVEEVGDSVKGFSKGDHVIVYPRKFDGTCDMCLAGNEMLCRNGGIFGLATDGGFREYIAVPEANLIKVPEDMNMELAASIPVAALTAYHALAMARLSAGETLYVVGASGNTGMFAVQLGKIQGAHVVAISGKKWLGDFGADTVVDGEALKAETSKPDFKKANVVVHSIGSKEWDRSMSLLDLNGRLVLFGALTGQDVALNVQDLYARQISIVGSTGGSKKEITELVKMAKNLKVRVWKRFPLEKIVEAFEAEHSEERDGRVMLTF